MSRPNALTPLTDSHLEQIKRSLLIADQALAAAEMAQRAGINVDEQLKSLTDSKQKLLQIKNVYFPNS